MSLLARRGALLLTLAAVPVALLSGDGGVADRSGDVEAEVAAEDSPAPVESERFYLSGTGPDKPRTWEFRIDSGRGAGEWRVIPVPSNWELQGFGRYTHGKQWWRPAEEAVYRTRFRAPRELAGRRVELVFEGVMTDAEVLLNGRPVGETHRGGFTRFAYDISTMLFFRQLNVLEVRVGEESSNASVNRAEREADYWTFGGIYRPVYLEIHPAASLGHLAVDARHDGRLTVDVEVRGPAAAEVRAQVETLDGQPVGDLLVAPLAVQGSTRISGRVEGVAPWSAESPNLYRLRVELVSPDGETLHRRRLRIGFRTVRLRPGVGLFVNGRQVVLKGVNRHSHWPDTGRSLAAAVNRRDVELIRSMNMNAVRTAHSPPDVEFLDACDELGLYVLDELPGWHDAYDTEIGSRILWEMVRRDVNHPSVILWANGNEGGWNTALDPLFGELDPQRRPVLHPGALGLGFEASHYPDWQELGRLIAESPAGEPAPVLMPTELLHALYDGGGGASLADYWRRLRSSSRLAGAFLWSLFDEGVVRSDRNGRIDTAGNRGADGLLGPHREREASYAAVRGIWSPIQPLSVRFEPEAVKIELANDFDHIDLSILRLRWRWLALPRLPEDGEIETVGDTGELSLPSAAPGESVSLELPRPPPETPASAVEIAALDAGGREIMLWVFADDGADPVGAAWRQRDGEGEEPPRVERLGDRLVVSAANGRWAHFDLDTGALEELGWDEQRLSLSGGARRADGRQPQLADLRVESGSRAVIVHARYEDGLEEAQWTFCGDGQLLLEWSLEAAPGDADFLGIGFDYPRQRARELTWLGEGPHRVWRNRQAGARLGLWRRLANDTVTGVDWRYPEFPGFYSDVRWARLGTSEGVVTLAPKPGLSLGIFTPRFPGGARTAVAEVPAGITVLHRISAIGTKFHPAEALGPAAARPPQSGPLRGGVWIRFDGVPGG